MMNVLEKKKVVLPMLLVLLLFFFSFTASTQSFPTGLILKYHVDDDIEGEWDELFVILQAESEQGDSMFLIEVSSTGGTTLQGSLHLNSSSWEVSDVNGTALDLLLQPPLWVDTSTWRIGDTVPLPTYAGRYHLSSEYMVLGFGTFLCWRVHSIAWFSVDDDYQLCSENWYFHHTGGILVKYTYEILASQHAIYTYKKTRELTESNFQHFGILSVQDQTRLQLQGLGLVVIPLTLLLTAIFIYRYLRSTRLRQTTRPTSV